ncbi:hypothetical protein [Lactiplantibacillus daowaiensis]|uniref:Extracellular protein n=1 Tax=Lactiplantibacillus daowaiensis TaxID=2559918 RepID=A0ABW1RZW8_9LACO|nr:hypothetical protein [Lactiplantibacillus daowaiensis]
MKLKKLGLSVATVALLMPVATLPAQAKSVTIAKSLRGTWISKPVYTYQMKHTKKNMAIPKMKMVIKSKTAKWQFQGYLPKGYNHKAHTLTVSELSGDMYVLKGTGPFGKYNYLAKVGKTVHYAYQHGGEIVLHKQ